METTSPGIRIPSLAELAALREEGARVGYRGMFIYLRYQAVLELVAGLRAPRALVVGCGFGIFDRLLPPDTSLVGVDLAEPEIAFARGWAAKHRPGFSYHRAALADLKLAEGSFDLVFLSEVVEHMPEKDIAPLLSEIDRVLAPGGRLVLTVPNQWTLRNRARRLIGLSPRLMGPEHLREYSPEAADLLAAAIPYTLEKKAGAVIYGPCETLLSRLVAPQSRLRRWLWRRAPATSSHLLYLLRKTTEASCS